MYSALIVVLTEINLQPYYLLVRKCTGLICRTCQYNITPPVTGNVIMNNLTIVINYSCYEKVIKMRSISQNRSITENFDTTLSVTGGGRQVVLVNAAAGFWPNYNTAVLTYLLSDWVRGWQRTGSRLRRKQCSTATRVD